MSDGQTTSTLEQELTMLLNRFSAENGSDTPDFILARVLLGFLSVWNDGIKSREIWYDQIATNTPTVDSVISENTTSGDKLD